MNAAVDTKTCTGCGQTKPRSEFYPHGKGAKVNPRCRDCDNARPRGRSVAKIVRVRARHRAVAELIERHPEEFGQLLEQHTVAARAEAAQLAEEPVAQEQYAPSETVRLRPGPRREHEQVQDRIDVGRCTECARHHDRGHICPTCGAMPSEQVAS